MKIVKKKLLNFISFVGFGWSDLETKTITPPIIPVLRSEADTSNFENYPEDSDLPNDSTWFPENF